MVPIRDADGKSGEPPPPKHVAHAEVVLDAEPVDVPM